MRASVRHLPWSFGSFLGVKRAAGIREIRVRCTLFVIFSVSKINGNELKKITLSNDTSNNSATVINSDEISDKGIYEGSFDLEQNVTLDLAGAANVLSLDNVVICKRSGTNDCSVDNNINVIYKFYND